MLQASRPNPRPLLTAALALLALLAAPGSSRAQSADANFPTPVFTSELSGRVAPRDVGDPRRTRHFYAFRGTEGDLSVTLEASQLIGDVDVFTAVGLRPLLKFTLFGDAVRLSKSFYLRKEETLVLRVEARAVGDAEGTYTVRFGGSFATAPAEMANSAEPAAPTLSASEPRGKGTRRVTSTGARIDEPKPEPTPVEEASEEARPAATPKPERSAERRGPAATRRGRGARTPPPRPRAGAATTRPEAAETRRAEESSAEAGRATEAPAAPAPVDAPRRRAPARSARRGSTRGGSSARPAEAAARPSGEAGTAPAPPPPAPPQRLIIVTRDGETLEHDMSAVRRVTVENNQVVIVGKDGKVTRRPLASVLKMSIEP